MFVSKDIIDRLSKKLKPNSIKIVNNSILRIYRDLFDTLEFDKKRLIDESEKIIKWTNKLPPTTKKTILNSIRHIVENEEYEKLYRKAFFESELLYTDKYVGKTPEYYIRLEDMEKLKGKYEKTKQLIYNLYTLIPPLRGQDYYNTKFYFGDKEIPKNCNYYNHTTKELVIRNSKTSKKHGVRIIKYPKIITDMIEKNTASHMDGDYLLLNARGKQFQQRSFTSILNRIYDSQIPIYGKGKNHHISIHIIRRTYISECLNYITDLEKQMIFRKKLSKILGHSLGTQWSIYQNNDKIKDIEWSSKKYMKKIIEIFNQIEIKQVYDI